MKIWHISDAHGYHNLLTIPEADMVVFSGDCSNYFDSARNAVEVGEFTEWFSALPIKHRLLVAGNHDTSIERRLITKQDFEQMGIIYLENEAVTIEGINFYGTPITPQFNQWAFMRARHKMDVVWNAVPEDTDVLISHGPPKGILDLTESMQHKLEQVGCKNMANRIEKLNLKYVLFGHIHDCEGCKNGGVMIRDGVTYSNGSVVKDGHFGFLTSNGNILNP
jgi:Icc-related predicted phosphoesterase